MNFDPDSPVNPTSVPEDAVILIVWLKAHPAGPITAVVTRDSWEMNRKVIMDNGSQFNPDRVYEFDGPIDQDTKRRNLIQLQGVQSWIASIPS